MQPSSIVTATVTAAGTGETEAAAAIEAAAIKVVREKIDTLAAGRMGHSTAEVGDLVAAELA